MIGMEDARMAESLEGEASTAASVPAAGAARMVFRTATEDDLAGVLAIIEDGRAALAAQGLDQWQGGSPSSQVIRDDVAAGRTQVAVDAVTGALLGTLAFVDTGEPDYSNVTAGAWLADLPNSRDEAAAAGGERIRFAALHRLATSATAVRRGVATFMVESSFALARERGLTSVRADTHAGNAPMQRTFEKCGMTRCCELEISDPAEPTARRIGYERVL